MNPLRRLLPLSAALGLLALGATAAAQTQGYVQKTKTIRAAVLLLASDHPAAAIPQGGTTYLYPQTAAPFAFYNLDSVPGAKPDGWSFVNPYAAGVVTREIRRRYGEIYGVDAESPGNANPTTAFPVAAVDQPISKRHGPYWTVELSKLSETQIASYDILLVAPKYYLQLNSVERDRLRRFVDGGGVLWVDLLAAGATGGLFDPMNNLPVSLQPRLGVTGAAYRDVASPVLNGPRTVSDSDLYYLLEPGADARIYANAIEPFQPPTAPTPNFPSANFTSIIAEFFRYRNVASVTAGANTYPVIAEARLGDGAVVVTARGAAEMLNAAGATDLLSYGANPAATSNVGYAARPAQLSAQGRAAARLAVNIASLGANYRQQGGGSRKQGSASADPGSPVLARFDTEQPSGSTDPGYGPGNVIPYGTAPNGAPVTYKGYLVETIGNRVVVFDAIPGRDLDGDGDPDDGIATTSGAIDNTLRDISVGKPLDVVWVSDPIGSTLNAPVCAEVPEAGGAIDQILATDEAGNLHAWRLTQLATGTQGVVGGFHSQLYQVAPPGGGSGNPQPPTVYDGLAYMADTTSSGGRLWVVDLSTGTNLTTANPWYVQGGGLPSFTSTPTIGYIPAADSPGGADRVLYAPGLFGTAPNVKPGFVSVWLGAKGETPTVTFDGTNLRLTTRAGASGGLPIYMGGAGSSVLRQLAPRLTLVKPNGDPLTAGEMGNVVIGDPNNIGDGTIAYTLAPGMTEATFNAAGYGVRLDYTVDWGFSPTTINAQTIRGQLVLPTVQSGGNPNKRILGPIALTSKGTLHMVEGSGTAPSTTEGGDSYFAIREDGGQRGQFRVVSRFTLYKSYTQTFGGSVGTQIPAVLGDNDAVQNFFPPALSGRPDFSIFNRFYFAGGVAIRNGIAYTAINASRTGGLIPVTMVAAFQAEPETAELRVGTNIGTDPQISQADFARSRAEALVATPLKSTLRGNQLVVDGDNGIIRIENLATVVRGEIIECLSRSQPIVVNLNGTDEYRNPDAEGDRWSPLLWFGLWNGGTATGTPLVAGNEVYLPAQSSLPNILAGNGFAPSGVVWSIDADAPTTGTYAVGLPNRPWLVQQVQLTATPFSASPYFRMPQNRGIQDFTDFVLRLNQTKLGSSTVVKGLSGGDGIVAGYTDRGVYGLSRADFLVCDQGRLLRVDSAGNPVANVFGGRFTGIGSGGSVAETRPLVRPVKAYPVGTGETLVVDAGSNRVMRLDDDGTVLRSLDRILLDRDHKPANYRANEPLGFKEPSDATTFEGYVYRGATEEVTAQQPVEYWVRTLVADSGNGRIVELSDRFAVDAQGRVGAPIVIPVTDFDHGKDPNTGNYRTLDQAQVGVLTWQSPVLAPNVGTFYNSVSRIYLGSTTNGRYVYVAGVSNARPTRSGVGLDNPQNGPVTSGGGGAVVFFDRDGGTLVFDRFALPNLQAVTYANGSTGGVATAEQPFKGVQAVTAAPLFRNNLVNVRVMVTDVDAVYEFALDANLLSGGNPPATLTPEWMINEAAFVGLRPSAGSNPFSFRPAFARRLDSGDVLLVNGYRGVTRDRAQEYKGEVTLLDGSLLASRPNFTTNLGFTLQSVRFELPPLTGIRGLVSPVFADRR